MEKIAMMATKKIWESTQMFLLLLIGSNQTPTTQNVKQVSHLL
jgi:hypothetical protein